jgi:hypothetical protein
VQISSRSFLVIQLKKILLLYDVFWLTLSFEVWEIEICVDISTRRVRQVLFTFKRIDFGGNFFKVRITAIFQKGVFIC